MSAARTIADAVEAVLYDAGYEDVYVEEDAAGAPSVYRVVVPDEDGVEWALVLVPEAAYGSITAPRVQP